MSENGARVIAAVRRIAAEHPERQYGDDCVYVLKIELEVGDTIEPGCLIGQGLWAAGLADASWFNKHWNQWSIESLSSKYDLVGEWDEEEIHWLMQVQERQDAGWEWARCVAWADSDQNTADYDA